MCALSTLLSHGVSDFADNTIIEEMVISIDDVQIAMTNAVNYSRFLVYQLCSRQMFCYTFLSEKQCQAYLMIIISNLINKQNGCLQHN